MKRLHLLALLPLLLAAPVAASEIPFPEHKDGPAIVPTPPKPGSLFSLSPGPRPGFAGYYMAGRHAQADEDWHAANYYLDITARKDPLNIEIKRRAMVIALGIGDMENAASLAQDVTNLTPDDSLAAFILGVKSVQEKDYEAALQKFTSMKGGLAEFAAPLVCVWIKSAKGTFDLSGLNPDQPLSAFHAALIGKALHKEDQALEFVSAVQKKSSLEASLKIADALLVLGQDARAKELYLALQKEQDTAPLRERLAALSSPEKSQALPFMKPLTPAEGAALALLDMAKIMSAQGSIDGARIFSQLSLALAEDQPEAHILLAAIYSETGHFDEALAQYANIAPTSRYAVDVQIRTATILESLGRTTDAIKNLEDQYKIH
ncbi:MAG: hypothetical protein H6855_07560, partial [Rhodospirillales bacterium]|nr:hypothetical protein [Rhodospirillales bacterium]